MGGKEVALLRRVDVVFGVVGRGQREMASGTNLYP